MVHIMGVALRMVAGSMATLAASNTARTRPIGSRSGSGPAPAISRPARHWSSMRFPRSVPDAGRCRQCARLVGHRRAMRASAELTGFGVRRRRFRRTGRALSGQTKGEARWTKSTANLSARFLPGWAHRSEANVHAGGAWPGAAPKVQPLRPSDGGQRDPSCRSLSIAERSDAPGGAGPRDRNPREDKPVRFNRTEPDAKLCVQEADKTTL